MLECWCCQDIFEDGQSENLLTNMHRKCLRIFSLVFLYFIFFILICKFDYIRVSVINIWQVTFVFSQSYFISKNSGG